MSSIIKFLKTIRNHWKKSTFAACAVTYGANYAKESYEIHNLMEEYCREALRYGAQSLQPGEKPRHVVVVLNPTANRRKSVKQFEQYCVPILHLAGISVDVIQTRSEGHARTIIQDLAVKTDAIVVGGGDGTVSECVTGVLRRSDSAVFIDACPFGVLPLGRENTFAAGFLRRGDGVHQVRRLADASMAIVRERTERADVMKITGRDDAIAAPAVYALTALEWGSYRDARAKREKYWYVGRLRNYAAYLFNGYKAELCWNCAANIEYTPPCAGCSNCYRRNVEEPQQNGRWWNSFVKKEQKIPPQRDDLQYVVNENCAKVTTKQIETADFHLGINSGAAPGLVLDLGPRAADITYWDFVADGWCAENGGKRTVRQTIEARQIDVEPLAQKMHFYSIDNEEYEVKPVRVTLLPKLIQFFV